MELIVPKEAAHQVSCNEIEYLRAIFCKNQAVSDSDVFKYSRNLDMCYV